MSWNWTSSDSNVASVSSSGVITGKAAGTATITASTTSSAYQYGYRSVSASITVKGAAAPDVYTIELSPNPASVQVGNTVTLTPTVKKNGSVYNYTGSFTWSSSATGKATVNNGVVTGVAAGSSTITAKATIEGKTIEGSATVNVTAADVYTIELSPDNQNIYVGGSTLTLTATVKKNGSAVTVASGDIAWSSSATSKATVSGNGATGTVTPVAAQDGVKITANYKNGTAVGVATVNVKANGVVDTEYQDLTVTIGASPTTIAAAGGNSTLTASVSYKTRDKYANGTYSSWTTVTSGVPKISGGANWITQLSNEAAKTKTVTAQKQANTGAQRKATYTASFTIGSLSESASCEITQSESTPSSTEYQNVSVTLTATPSSIAASGGSSTLSASGTWQERIKYTNGDYGSWTSKSTTNFSDFTISGSATGFTRNGASVTVAANTGAARSVTYTAKLTKGSVTGSGEATITQAAYVPDDHFEWIDTEISVDAGGTATAQFYSSKALSPTTLYDGGYTDGLSVEYNAPTSTGSTGTRAYKGTATIKAKSTAGGTTQTVTGQTGNSNDQLKVTVERPYYIISIVIEGPSEITPEYPQNVQYNCIVRARTPQGTKTFYSNRNPEYFTWSSEQFTLVDNNTGTFNVRSATAGTLKCTFNYSGELSGTADYFVKQVNSATQPEYEYVSAETKFVKNWSDGRAEWKVVVKMRESGTSNYAYIDLTSSSFAGNNELRAVWEWNYTDNVWQTGDHLIPSGAQFRVKVYYKDSLMWTSQVHNN